MRGLDITEVAGRSGVPASTLRFYEEKRLIASVGRRGQRRVFDTDVLQRLALIALGRATGFSSTRSRACSGRTAGRASIGRCSPPKRRNWTRPSASSASCATACACGSMPGPEPHGVPDASVAFCRRPRRGNRCADEDRAAAGGASFGLSRSCPKPVPTFSGSCSSTSACRARRRRRPPRTARDSDPAPSGSRGARRRSPDASPRAGATANRSIAGVETTWSCPAATSSIGWRRRSRIGRIGELAHRAERRIDPADRRRADRRARARPR